MTWLDVVVKLMGDHLVDDLIWSQGFELFFIKNSGITKSYRVHLVGWLEAAQAYLMQVCRVWLAALGLWPG